MLKVRNTGGGGGGGGGGGKGRARFWSDMKSECVCVGGGGDAVRFKSDTKSGGLWHTLSLYLITNGYNFDRGGCSKAPGAPSPGADTEISKREV